jgi:NTP pyrophosphatase (non-canonical NTP hydrolase)
VDIKTYQDWTNRTAIYPKDGGITYAVIGLANEAGEVLGVIKKMIRDDNSKLSEEKKEKILDEVGDVLWYAARVCVELGVDVEDVLQRNHDKLEDRLARNVIQGSGDNR